MGRKSMGEVMGMRRVRVQVHEEARIG